MKTLALGVLLAGLTLAQVTDPLAVAYDLLKTKDYDRAIPAFLLAVEAHPRRADIRKDLAYAYLKVGESEAARDQFGEAMVLDPTDTHVALEYAFLCYESREDAVIWKATARRLFNQLREIGNAQAEVAFQNIDRPLAEGIERWKSALQHNPNYSSHFELAQLAEQRDQLDLAAEHYLAAWQALPTAKSTLVDLGRVLLASGREEEATSALLAASRSGEPRAAELAREVLPQRYPFVYEFRRALTLDSKNVTLHRELAYLLLKMSENLDGGPQKALQLEAEDEFRIIVASAPNDVLSCAQLGFLYLGRKELDKALPLLKRVLGGEDKDLANKVRVALHLDPVLEKRAQLDDAVVDARVMADRSYSAGYIKDALRYLTIAHEEDPQDDKIVLKLGYAENMLHNDEAALIWFDLARRSPDPSIASQARRAFANLRPNFSKIRTTAWISPFFSTRWNDNFAYGQVKTEWRIKGLPFHPYASVRFVGDTRQYAPGPVPQSLSESSFILGAGLATDTWHRATFWGEVGRAVPYLGGQQQMDVRGGVAWARLWGHSIFAESGGGFLESNVDGVFVSRFGNDTLASVQNRAGYTLPSAGPVQSQVFVNANITQDTLRQYWANSVEFGPGARLHFKGTPQSLLFSVSIMRGAYTHNRDNPRRPNFFDVRAGFWYAFSY